MEQHAHILSVLGRHIGAANAITVKQLDLELRATGQGMGQRRIRTIVEELRLEGQHICAHPKRGYWMADNEKELEETCDFLRSRAVKSLRQVAAMTKQALPDLLGQLHLKT